MSAVELGDVLAVLREGWSEDRDQKEIEEAIIALGRRAPVSAGKVKALVWSKSRAYGVDLWEADGYEISYSSRQGYFLKGLDGTGAPMVSHAAAVDAAQADHERRILAQLQPGNGWQGIDSAPKDGTEFLGIKWSWRYPRNCYWDGQRGSFENPFDAAFADQPTHWMPFSALGRPPASLPQGEDAR